MPLPQDENPTPGFVSLQQYLTANQGSLGDMTKTLADTATSQGTQAQREADQFTGQVQPGTQPSELPGYQQASQDAQKASQYGQSLTSYGGLRNDVQGQYGKGGAYTPGDASFDATLLGTAGPQSQFQGIAKQYGGLDQYLQDATRPSAIAGGGPGSRRRDQGIPNKVDDIPAPSPGPSPSAQGQDNPWGNFNKWVNGWGIWKL